MDQPSLFTQIFSSVGAFCCLSAYAGHQLKLMNSNNVAYSLLNAIGGGILAYIALRPLQVGFLILESAWMLISLWGFYKSLCYRKLNSQMKTVI